MPWSLTRRVLLSATTLAVGSIARPLDGFGQSKKKLPPCEARRSFGNWQVKIWDTLGGLQGSVWLAGGQAPGVPQDRCVLTNDYPGLYLRADPNGKPGYSVGFGCPNAMLSRQFDVVLLAGDGTRLSARLDAHALPIEKTSASAVWLDGSSLFAGAGADILRQNRLTLTLKGDGNAGLQQDFDSAGFADAWAYFRAQFAALTAQRDKQCGCFITTACCESLGLGDDCFELRTLRAFRDGPMRRMARGSDDIARYYEVAPFMLRAIHANDDRRLLRGIYGRYILPSALAAHVGMNALARAIYTNMMRELEQRYGDSTVSRRAKPR